MKRILRRKSSRDVARDRLRILLISDRVNCSPETMELIKADITKVLSKYMKIDAENMDVQISAKAKSPILNANVPILDVHKTV